MVHHFKADLFNFMGHMRGLNTHHLSLFTQSIFAKFKIDTQMCKKQAKKYGLINQQNYNFNHFLIRHNLMLLKRYEVGR